MNTRNLLLPSWNQVTALAAYWPRTFGLIRTAAPRWTVAWATLLVLQGVHPLASVYLVKLLVDSLVVAAKSGGDWVSVRPAIVLIALTVGVMLIGELLQSMSELVRTAQSELVQDHIRGLIHQQSATMDLSVHESPEFQDRLERVRNDASSRPLVLLESVGSLLQNSITLLAMALVLVPFGLWLPLVLLLSTLPAFVVVVVLDRRHHAWWYNRASERRWAQYYDLLLTHTATAPELRLFGLAPHFQGGYQKIRKLLRNERMTQIKKQGQAKLAASAFAQLVSGIALALVILKALRGAATLGDLALFYQAFSRGQGLLRSLLGNLGQIYSSSLFLENLFAFLDMRPQLTEPTRPVPAPVALMKGIEFQNITFRYPGSQQPALQNFNLSIPAGKLVAIVGANGAGKTTLLKILCRFYDPEHGRVELDGIDVRDLSLDELRRMTTVLFQFPFNYQATAGQSIAMGDLASEPGEEAIESAARSAGAHELITRLPNGYDTLLGKTFANGVELSGGEWHRIATARAYLRKSPIILLDEPTSMMDSWTEADWFARFRELAQGHTAVVITHRFSIAMRADIIHVMEAGKIIESGSHRELLEQGGLYAQSWLTQMQAGSDSTDDVLELTALPQFGNRRLQHVEGQDRRDVNAA
ncbi:MAG: ABC transporter ATP-binding protein/permease [Pyrinomonadaceae bacterium]|nr:ABC transporter ATP-binding protein/permease [Pyrinomonadaceae bacterium]